MYKRLFRGIQQSDNVGSELISHINSISIPQALVNESRCDQSFISSTKHVTDSLADHVLLSAVESICFENGIQSISHDCLESLTHIMHTTIQNLAIHLHNSSVPLKPEFIHSTETKTGLSTLDRTSKSTICIVLFKLFTYLQTRSFLSLIFALLSKHTSLYTLLQFMQKRLEAYSKLVVIENDIVKLYEAIFLI